MANNSPIPQALCVSVHSHLPTAASHGSNMMVSYHPVLNLAVTFLISFPLIRTNARHIPVSDLSTYLLFTEHW